MVRSSSLMLPVSRGNFGVYSVIWYFDQLNINLQMCPKIDFSDPASLKAMLIEAEKTPTKGSVRPSAS